MSNVDNSQQSSNTPGVAATATLPAPHACTSTGIADYGILELGTTITGNNFSGSVSTQYIINFTLSDPSRGPNTPITLQIPVQYDLDMSVTPGGIGGQSNGADFAIYLDSNVNPFWLYRVATSTDSFGNGNICPSPQPTLPACNGHYEGTVTALLNTFINAGPQRLWITASGSVNLNTNGTAAIDALHTITLGNILLPNGVSYAYDISGNPAHFTYAAPAAAVPEPSTWWLMTGGLGVFLAVRRRTRRVTPEEL